jgi:DNA-binding MarR family transcriptional regulator|tara:strand:+ start:12690 stop:12977 length:288 start_codon:yes stop_codon:yes gene_type:complete
MSLFRKQLSEAVSLVSNLEQDIRIVSLTSSQKKILYSVLLKKNDSKDCNISNVIEYSNLSRSTVFKSLKFLEAMKLIVLQQSDNDRREFNIEVIL